MSKEKPTIVYLHRYPPEIECLQWPALRVLADELAPDYQLVYACMGPSDGKRDEKLRRQFRVLEQPFTVDQSNARDKGVKTLRWYLSLGGLLRKIHALHPALILCKEALPFIPYRVARTGVPTVIAAGDWWWSILMGNSQWGRWLADRLETVEVRSWNRPNVRVTVCSRTSAKLLQAKGLDAGHIAFINEPQNPGVFQPLDPLPEPADLGLDGQLKYFAVFGIIRKGKGYDQLLDWWRTASLRHADWRLVIIGGAGGENWCQREIEKRGLGAVVHMTGWLPTKQEVNRWLNAMNAVIVHRRNSPDNEGIIPSALFNGLSCGRPVVATALSGIAEVVRDGVDGFLYTPDAEDSFVEALERVAADPAAAARIGKAGWARAAECFNPQASAKAHHVLFDSMIGAGIRAE